MPMQPTTTTLAEAGVTFEYSGQRWRVAPDDTPITIVAVPYTTHVTFEEDYDADWSWLDQPEWHDHWQHDPDSMYGLKYGNYGPIDAEGREHAALGVIIRRYYDDGHTVEVDSLWTIDCFADDRSLIGITDNSFTLDEVLAWRTTEPDTSGLNYLGHTVANMDY